MPQFRAPRGTRDLLPAERAAFARLEGDRPRAGRPVRLPARWTRRSSRRARSSSAASARPPTSWRRSSSAWRRRAARRATGGRCGRRRPPASCRAYLQHGMQALPQPVRDQPVRPDVPLRPATGGPLPRVLAVGRRGHRRPRSGGRRGADRARPALLRHEWRGRRGRPPQFDRRRPVPPGVSRATARLLRGACQRPRPSRGGTTEGQPAAAPRFEGSRPGGAHRRRAAPGRPPVRAVRRPSRGRAGAPRGARHRAPPGADARARARLLHPHRLRVLPPGRHGPAAGPGRRRPL